MSCSRWIDKNSKGIEKYISIRTYANTHLHKYSCTGLTIGLTLHKSIVADLKREYQRTQKHATFQVPKLH